MKITSIQITRRDNTGTKLKATVSIVLDNMVVIHDIKVLENAGAYFLAMPSKSTKMGTFKDIVHPINQDVRKAFEQLIIGAFKRVLEQNCTRMELQLLKPLDIELLEQSCDMFEVVNSSTHSAHIDVSNTPTASLESKSLHSLSKSTTTEDDDELMKWLES